MTPEDLVEIELIKRLKYTLRPLPRPEALGRDRRVLHAPTPWRRTAAAATAFEGRDAIVDFLRALDGRRDVPFEPQDAPPRDRPHRARTRRTASGRSTTSSCMTDFELTIRGCSFYDDEYVKQDGALAHPAAPATSACSRRSSRAATSRACRLTASLVGDRRAQRAPGGLNARADRGRDPRRARSSRHRRRRPRHRVPPLVPRPAARRRRPGRGRRVERRRARRDADTRASTPTPSAPSALFRVSWWGLPTREHARPGDRDAPRPAVRAARRARHRRRRRATPRTASP